MTAPRTLRRTQREQALQALEAAILEGATPQYERLVNVALAIGVSEDELDLLIHNALELMFLSAEQPVTNRELASFSPGTFELQFV